MSEVEAARRTSGAVGSITLQLPDVLFRKLTSDIETAKSQMAAYDADNSVRRIVYIIVNFDDNHTNMKMLISHRLITLLRQNIC